MARGPGRPRDRRRRPHRGQRRRREQDRHVRSGGARRAITRSRSTSPRPRRRSTSRPPSGAAIAIEERDPDEVTQVGGRTDRAGRCEGVQPRVRRHAGPARDRDRHRGGSRPSAVPAFPPRAPPSGGGDRLGPGQGPGQGPQVRRMGGPRRVRGRGGHRHRDLGAICTPYAYRWLEMRSSPFGSAPASVIAALALDLSRRVVTPRS